MKDRLLSGVTRTLERISKNPLVEESISFNRVNPVWDRFLIMLLVIRPVTLEITMTYRGNFSKHPIAPETVSPAYIHGHVWHSLRTSNYKPTQTTLLVCLSRDAPCVSEAIGSLRGHPSI